MIADKFHRSERLAGSIQRELGKVIQSQLKDPRVNMASISAVKCSRDLTYAKIYMSFLSQEEDQIKQSIEILNKAVGFLKVQLSKRVKLRVMPELNFVYDASIIEGERISRLIDSLKTQDDSNEKD